MYPCVLALLCVGAGLLVDRASGGWLPGMLLRRPGRRADRGVAAEHLRRVPRAGDAVCDGCGRGGRAGRWGGRGCGRSCAAGGSGAGNSRCPCSSISWRWPRFCSRAGPRSPLIRTLDRLGVPLAGRRLPDAPRPALLAPGSARLLRPVPQRLLQHRLPVRRRHAVRRQRVHTGAPLIWAFQPFNAFMLALAAGPAWVLARRIGLAGGWAALAALTATVPALVYGYELVASVKEIVALAMILTLGALVVLHPRWLWRGAAGAIPFAVVLAAGVSTLGVGFGAWALAAAVLVLAAIASATSRAGRRHAGVARAARPRRRDRARRRAGHLGGPVRIAARSRRHRLDEQSGQPAHAAACRAGAGDLAVRAATRRAHRGSAAALLRDRGAHTAGGGAGRAAHRLPGRVPRSRGGSR